MSDLSELADDDADYQSETYSRDGAGEAEEGEAPESRLAHLLQHSRFAEWPETLKTKVDVVTAWLPRAGQPDWPATDKAKATEHILDKHLLQKNQSRLGTWTAEAQLVQLQNTSRTAVTYKHMLFEISALMMLLPLIFWCSAVYRITQQIEAGTLQGVAFFLVLQFDEASAELLLQGSSGDVLDETQTKRQRARVTQLWSRVAVLLQDASAKHDLVSMGLWHPLVPSDRVTAETMFESMDRASHVLALTAGTRAHFAETIVVQTADSALANEKATAAARREDANAATKQTRLSFGCDVHRAATIATKSFDLLQPDIAGLLAMAIQQRGAGAFNKMQDVLAALLVDDRRLHIVRGAVQPLPAEVSEHRLALLELCLPKQVLANKVYRKGSQALNEQRLHYEAIFNGDIRDKRIWHYVDVHAPSDAELKITIQKHGVAALLPSLLKLFPRHRWTGSQRVFRSAALLAGTHHLLHDVLYVWLQISEPVPQQPQQPQAERMGDPEADSAEATGYDTDDDATHALPADNAGHIADGALERQANVAAPMASALEYRHIKNKLIAWAQTDPMEHLVLLTVCSEPCHKLMSDLLFMAGEEWELQRDSQRVRGQSCSSSRVLDAHLGQAENLVARSVLDKLCLSSCWLALPEESRTCANRHLAFTLLSRSVGGVFLLLKLPHTCPPFSLFGLLQEDVGLAAAAAADLKALPRCRRDAFSHEFLESYTQEQLAGVKARSILAAAAELARTEISGVEIGHAQWQQDARIRSIRTHKDALSCTSANFLLHQARQDTSLLLPRPVAESKQKAKGKFKVGPRKRPWQSQSDVLHDIPRKVHGGGGPWRAFVKEQLAGKPKPSSAEFRALKQQYASLSPQHKHSLELQGQAMTISRACGFEEDPDAAETSELVAPDEAEQVLTELRKRLSPNFQSQI